MTGTNNTARFGVSDNQITTIGISLQDPEGVLHVLAKRNNFQILKPVVRLVSVLMIDSHFRRDPNKGLSHKPMDVAGRFLGPHANDHLLIPIGGVDIAMKESGCLTLDADDSAYASQTTDFVLGEVFDGSPFFHTCHFTLHGQYGQGKSS